MTNPIRTLLTATLLVAIYSPSMADSISGYAKANDSNLVKFELSIDASDAGGAPGGSIQYRRGNSETKSVLNVNATVSCMWLSADGTRALAAGPATVEQNPGNDYVNEWFFGAVQKVPGDLERVRAGFTAAAAGQAMCQSGESLFPGVVESGGYVIERDSDAQAGNEASASSTSNMTCNAYFKFDDTITDAGPNAYDGEMFGAKGGSATPVFSEGKFGHALTLDGTSAMRALLDLNYDLCPQITISAWIKLARDAPGDNLHLLSTGGGASPGLIVSGTSLHLHGTENGILKPNALRKGSWMFVAGVYDYLKGEYALYSGASAPVPGVLSPYRADPQNAFWVGTVHDAWGTFASGIAIDELKITGRALSSDQIAVLRSTKPSPGDPSSTTTQEPTSVAPTLPACNAQADCATGSYCAFDKSCHPETHLPMRDIDLVLAPVPIQTITPADVAAAGVASSDSDDDGTELRDLPEDLGLTAGGAGMDPELTVLGDQPGSGDIQTEFEYRPPTPNDAIVCDVPVVPVMSTKSNRSFPEGFVNALNQVAECGYYPQVVVLNDSDQWIISAGEQIAHSANLPAALAEKLKEFESSVGQLDAADLTTDGRWMIVAGDKLAQVGIPNMARLRAGVIKNRGRVVSFSMDPTTPDRWLMIDESGNLYGDRIPWQINAAKSQFSASGILPRQARFFPNGSWILLGNDHWYISDGLRDNQLRDLNFMRKGGSGMEHVLGYKEDGVYMAISNGPPPARSSDPIWRVENNLNGIANDNIWSRMAEHNVTGVVIAVVRNNQIAWTRGYGLRNSRELESFIQPNTTTDVASVSKAVSAFALMQLAEDGLIDLSKVGGLEDVEDIIPTDKLSDFRDNIQPENGNIIQVLQHCAGTCYAFADNCSDKFEQGGAFEYSANKEPPTTAQVLLGTAPAASNGRLVRNAKIGEMSRYSSANYNLIQALIDVHGGGFVAHTDRLFADLGMTSSTFASPFVDRNGVNFARGHDYGVPQPMVAYGELSAASLVSTAADIARFVITVNQGGGEVLSNDSVDQFLGRDSSVLQYCSSPGAMALGMNHRSADANWGNNETFWHNGDHNGYHAKMIGLPARQTGLVVIMTAAGPDANSFYAELKSSFAEVYGIVSSADLSGRL